MEHMVGAPRLSGDVRSAALTPGWDVERHDAPPLELTIATGSLIVFAAVIEWTKWFVFFAAVIERVEWLVFFAAVIERVEWLVFFATVIEWAEWLASNGT